MDEEGEPPKKEDEIVCSQQPKEILLISTKSWARISQKENQRRSNHNKVDKKHTTEGDGRTKEDR